MRCPEARSIGAYVLGALDPHERLEVERHLEVCSMCRQELVEVAHLPGLLHRLTLDDVTKRAATPNKLHSLPEATTVVTSAGSSRPNWRRHRLIRSRKVLVAATIGAVLLAGASVGRELLAEPGQQASSGVATWSATDAAGGTDATARLASEPWGTFIQLQMQDLPSGQTCQLVVHARTGSSQVAGWWSTSYEADLNVSGSTSIPLSDIDRVDVVTSDNTVLATLRSMTR